MQRSGPSVRRVHASRLPERGEGHVPAGVCRLQAVCAGQARPQVVKHALRFMSDVSRPAHCS